VVIESKCEDFKGGDHVVPHHHVACGECYLCNHGAETMCAGFRSSNFDPGGFADEFKVSEYNVKRSGVHGTHGLSHEEASFAEPLGCCLRGLNKVIKRNPSNMEDVLVVGAGPIGLLHMEILRSRMPELKLIALDVNSTRLDFAEKNEGVGVLDARRSRSGLFSGDALKQIETPGYDLVIVATGNSVAFAESIRCVRKAGTLLLFGAARKGSMYSLDIQSMLLSELTITSSYGTTERELDEALRLLESGDIKVRKFITSSYPLGRIVEAMTAAKSESQVKVLVTG
ncbi:MAG: zinc-binding dehydrogenase, partial [Nitrososphaerales archaeon]